MNRPPTALLQHIRRLVRGEQPAPGSDRELLALYAATRDDSAFAALVRRHGTMVWNACRRALGHHQDAEDVFQATFLVLARKAAAVQWRDSVAPWLYAVAQRLASKARAEAARRPRSADVEPAAPDPLDAISARDLLAALDAEVAGLPERCRGPVVLCWLEGHTQEEAARQLGESHSTVRRRLEDGKRLLQSRLTRRGLAPAGALLAAALAPAAAPAHLVDAAARCEASAAAKALAHTMVAGMSRKLRVALALVLFGAIAAGATVAGNVPAEPPPPAPGPAPIVVAGQPPPRVDALGDPLPEGALMRLGSIRLRHGVSMSGLAWSRTADLLITAGMGDRAIRFWDPATGKELRTLKGPDGGVGGLAISADGKWLAGIGGDGTVIVWDVESGKEIRKLDKLPEYARPIAFAAKGTVLAAAGGNKVRVWDAATGKVLHAFDVPDKDGNQVQATCIALAPDGSTVVVGYGDETARLWDLAGGKLVHLLQKHNGPLVGVTYAPDGKTLLTVGYQAAQLWSLETGKKLDSFGGQRAAGSMAVFSPDGRFLATAGKDGVARVWDWAGRKEVARTHKMADHIRSVAFSRDGKTLATVADPAAVLLWDAATGEPKGVQPGHQGRLVAVAVTPDGGTIITCAWDGSVRLWDARTGKQTQRLQIASKEREANDSYDPGMIRQLVVSPDGKLLAVLRGEPLAIVYELPTLKEVRQIKGANSIAFSPDGKLIAVGQHVSVDKTWDIGAIVLYDRGTGEQVRVLRGHLTQVHSLSFTPDSKTLLSCGVVYFGLRSGDPGEDEKQHVRVWDVERGKQRPPAKLGSVNLVTLAGDGRTGAVLTMLGREVALWELVTREPRGVLKGHKDSVAGVAWAPDGRTVATASFDGTVKLWDPFTGKELGSLEGHRGWVMALAFAPDGKTLVSGGIDTTALVWDVERFTNRKGAALADAELAACWDDLARSGEIAYAAIGKLAGSPKQAAALLREKLQPAPAADAKRIAQLIADLGSKQFKERDAATRQLEKLGQVAAPPLREALKANLPLEDKRRLELLLDKLEDASLAPETLRQVRAVEALEGLGTAEARAVLQGLVEKGAPEARLTQEAAAALRRMK